MSLAAMRLYVRTVVVVAAAISVLYLVIGIPRIVDFEHQESVVAAQLAGPGLALATERIAGASDREAELAALQPAFSGRLRLVEASRGAPDRGVTEVRVEGSQLLVRRRIDASTALEVRSAVDFGPSALFLYPLLVAPLVLGGVAAAVLVLPLTRRLGVLGRAIGRFAEGDLRARSPVGGIDAVGTLSARFNQMATEIERLVESKRQLLEAVSHELRTPISRIRFELELLALAATDTERTRRADNIDDSLLELDELVEEVLTYVRLDGGTPEQPCEQVSATAIVRGVFEAAATLRPEIGIELVDADREIVLEANARYLRRALRNLVVNAVRHASARVRVTSRVDGEHVVIRVEDDGPGVPEADRQRIFDPFLRLDASRDRDAGGIGLGLAIVQRICAWHGGVIEVGASELGGARFVSRWPLTRSRPTIALRAGRALPTP